MRSALSYGLLGAALTAGGSAAHAQTVDTVIAPQPAPAPVETVETVRTVQSTTVPRHRLAARDRITTTRTTVTQRVVPAPAPIYDVVTPAAVPAPAVPGIAPVSPVPVTASAPAYRYVYETDRILIIDPYTNIAVQAIPR